MLYDLGIVIPVYNSSQTIETLTCQIRDTFKNSNVNYRIILVDDHSLDDSPQIIDRLALSSSIITSIQLAANFGQQNALLCGIRHASNCKYVATMDDDLQHPPELLKQLYMKIRAENADIVYAVPTQKHAKCYRRIGSALRNFLFCLFTKKPKDITVGSFRIFNARTFKFICTEEQSFVYLSASAYRRPLKTAKIDYTHQDRAYGKSGYSVTKLLKLGWNLFRYYTKLGAIFIPKLQKAQYIIQNITLPGLYSKRLMILGGSLCQVNAFKLANKLGYQTILADYLPAPPAAALADLHLKISSFDRQACEFAAEAYRVDGIITLGTDQPVYTMAWASEKLSLSCPITKETAFLATNKKAMKERFLKSNIPTVAYRLIDENSSLDSLDGMNRPLVIKPLDSQGQRGIFKLDTPRDVLEHLTETLSFSSEKEALVEEFYPSEEITVSGWVSDGKLMILSVTDRKHYADEVHIGISNEHRFPSKHMSLYHEIKSISDNIAKAFKISDGPLYIQMLVGEDGIKVNEIACRIGGAFEDVFIPHITGFDILEAVIKWSLGKKDDIINPTFDITDYKKEVSVQLMFCKSGTISSITSLSMILELPYVLDAGYNYHEGDTIPSVCNATARFGHCVLVSDEKSIESVIDDFYSKFQVLSETGENLILRP